AGALLEIPVLIMVIRPSWIVSAAGTLLTGSDAGSNIGEFILFGGLGLIGVVLLGGGVGAMMATPAAGGDADGEPEQPGEQPGAPDHPGETEHPGAPEQPGETEQPGEQSAASGVGH